jgi:cell division protein FtsB
VYSFTPRTGSAAVWSLSDGGGQNTVTLAWQPSYSLNMLMLNAIVSGGGSNAFASATMPLPKYAVVSDEHVTTERVVEVQRESEAALKAKVAQLADELGTQKARNEETARLVARLEAEIGDLREGLEMVEDRARSELGMVKPNEILVQIAK